VTFGIYEAIYARAAWGSAAKCLGVRAGRPRRRRAV